MRQWIVVLAIMLVALAAACDSRLKNGQECTGDDECAQGSTCVAVNNVADGGCVKGQKLCKRPCTDDSSCKGAVGVNGDETACAVDCAQQRYCSFNPF